jgi:quercetin dioxygenase-like cupin family protein
METEHARKINETYRRPDAHERVKSVNFPAIDAVGPDVRMSMNLIDADSGTEQSAIHYVRTPPGSGSPKGLHTHPWEQTFYILEGVMTVEIEGEPEPFDLQPGDVVVFPRNVAHRNWNRGDVETRHLAFNTPRKGDEAA